MISDQELDKKLLTLKIIWFALLMSLAVYLIVGLQVAATINSSIDADALSIIKTVLYAVGFANLIVTRHIRNLILSAGKGQYSQQNPAFSQLSLYQKYVTATIVSLAMSESIGVFGFVLFLLGKDPTDLYLLILISATAMFMYRPKKEELADMLRENNRYPPTGGTAV